MEEIPLQGSWVCSAVGWVCSTWWQLGCPPCIDSALGDGYRLCVVSADHLAVQGGLTDVLRQLAVGFSRPQSQSLVAWLRELYRDRLRQFANPACGRSSALSLVLFLYVCHSIHCLQLVHLLSATVGSKIPPPSWWSEAFLGSRNITSLPLRTR